MNTGLGRKFSRNSLEIGSISFLSPRKKIAYYIDTSNQFIRTPTADHVVREFSNKELGDCR